jgi:threonine synthase
VKNGTEIVEPQKPNTIARSLAIGNPADGPYAAREISSTAANLPELVTEIEGRFPALHQLLCERRRHPFSGE